MRSNAFVDVPLLAALLVGALAAAQPCPSRAQVPQPERGNVWREQLRLGIGEQKVVDAEGVRSFSEGVKGIVDIRLTPENDQFVVVGLKPGKTTVLFIMLDGSEVHYEITVEDPNAPRSASGDAVERRDNIRLDFYFVQLSNNYSHNIGVGWPGSIGADVAVDASWDLAAGGLSGASAVVSSQVLPRLDLAQADGWAKIMRKAAVITANGTAANFFGGGELNIPVSGGFGGSIKQVSFGSQIGVRPRYDRETGRIELQITADVSDLSDDNGTGVPGRMVSTLETVVNLEIGQSLVLAGLSAASESGSQTGLPGLSQIPVLGVLFGSNASQVSATENVVFIVPTVMDTASPRQRSVIADALAAYEEYDGDLPDKPLMPARVGER